MSSSYQISGVKLVQPSDDLWIVRPATPSWFLPALGGGVFIFLGLVFLAGGGGMLLVSGFFFVTAAYFMITYPLSAQVCFDFSAREMIYTAHYLLRRSRHVEWCVPFQQIVSLGLLPRPFGKRHVAQLQLQDGAALVMDFGRRVAEAEQFAQRFAPRSATTGAAVSGLDPITSRTDFAMAQARVQRETRSWGTWLIVMGILQMLSVRGFSPWGIVLIIVGAASFYFREAPMLVIYAVTVGWAGVQNLLFGSTIFWKGFAILQAWIVLLLLRQFWQFRRAEKLATEAASALPIENVPASALPRTERWFPLVALLLGGIAALLFIVVLGGLFVLRNRALLPLLSLLETLAVNMAVLGVATGLAGWLSIASNKWVSIVGCLAGGLTLAAELALLLIVNALS